MTKLEMAGPAPNQRPAGLEFSPGASEVLTERVSAYEFEVHVRASAIASRRGDDVVPASDVRTAFDQIETRRARRGDLAKTIGPLVAGISGSQFFNFLDDKATVGLVVAAGVTVLSVALTVYGWMTNS